MEADQIKPGSFRREKQWIYPIKALSETMLNAFAHDILAKKTERDRKTVRHHITALKEKGY